MTTLSSSEFDYNKETKTFSADISMLTNGGRRNVFVQVYNDAIDQGVRVVSVVTGKEVVYVVDGIDYLAPHDCDEIAGWRLIPTDESIRKVPQCKGTKMLIVND
jgi:hypothetical protein